MKQVIIILILLVLNCIVRAGDIFVDENHNTKRVYGLPTPGTSTDAATKGYVDGAFQPLDTDLTAWAAKTTYAGNVTVTTGKTFNCTGNLTLAGTDGSTLNMGGGGTLGTAAYTATGAYEVPLTFSTGLTRSTNTVTVNTSQNIATLSNLTTNGFVKTGGAVGTLSVDTGTYVTSSATGMQTWLTTPSSANLRGTLTDENGTGAALFSGATAPDFTTGFTIGAAAASGKIPIGNGTNYVPSTPTWPTAAGTAGKHVESDGTNLVMSTPTYPTAAGAAGYTMRSNATNFQSYPAQLINSSVSAQSPSTSDVYLAGSNIVVTAGDFKATGQYKCVFDMTKSAGTGAIVITLRVGTLGTTGDAAIQTYTFGAGTSVADFGLFEVIATWRTVGSGTSAVMQGMCRGTHQLATTGLFNNAAGWMVLGSPSPSSGFASNTATNIGISFNGSTAFAGTTQVVQAQLQQ